MLPISSVWPSGLARATCAVPMLPPPPPLFSTTTGTPRSLPMGPASTRATMSVVPPAAAGTTMVIGRSNGSNGTPCALAGNAARSAGAMMVSTASTRRWRQARRGRPARADRSRQSVVNEKVIGCRLGGRPRRPRARRANPPWVRAQRWQGPWFIAGDRCAGVLLALTGSAHGSDRGLRAQPGPAAGVVAERAQYRLGVLAHGGHRVHAVVEPVVAPRRQQRRHLAGRRWHVLPAPARGQLRVRPQARHVVDAGVGNLRLVQARHHLRAAQAGEGLLDDGLQRGAVLAAPRVGVEARVAGALGILQ